MVTEFNEVQKSGLEAFSQCHELTKKEYWHDVFILSDNVKT